MTLDQKCMPDGEHEEGGCDEDGEPEPEEHVELLVDHVEGEHAQAPHLVRLSATSEPVWGSEVETDPKIFHSAIQTWSKTVT